MATTDGERLHAGTLRKVIGWHEAQAAAAASKYHRERKHNGSSTADVEVAVHERAAQAFKMFLALATEADAQPPRLSTWVDACEGTGLGEPVAAVFDRGTWGIMLGRHHIALADHGDTGRDVTALLYQDGEEPTVCSTPAELRACLVRLAGERT